MELGSCKNQNGYISETHPQQPIEYASSRYKDTKSLLNLHADLTEMEVEQIVPYVKLLRPQERTDHVLRGLEAVVTRDIHTSREILDQR